MSLRASIIGLIALLSLATPALADRYRRGDDFHDGRSSRYDRGDRSYGRGYRDHDRGRYYDRGGSRSSLSFGFGFAGDRSYSSFGYSRGFYDYGYPRYYRSYEPVYVAPPVRTYVYERVYTPGYYCPPPTPYYYYYAPRRSYGSVRFYYRD